MLIKPPDLIVLAVIVLATTAIVGVLGWPTKEVHGWHTFLFGALPLADTCIAIFWFLGLGGKSCRLWAFRLYYKFCGPRCHMEVMGTVEVDACSFPSSVSVLQTVLLTSRKWNPAAKETAHLKNRTVIQAGARTLTVDSSVFDLATAEDDVDEAAVDGRRITFTLRGYEGTLGRLDEYLQGEVVSLLEALTMLGKGLPSTFSLQATIAGINPFLLFYLRDVPSSEDIKSFRLQLTKEEHGNQVAVYVTSDSISVSARTPSALVESAKRYLATPALSAHRH